MTVLDTFVLLFKSDSSATKKDISALEKQIDDLTLKGKKRTELEDKALKESIKRHKELNDVLKQQTKDTDELGNSFGKIIESGAAALTGFATIGGIKSGILDAQELNRQLFILSKTTELSAKDIKAFGSAYTQSGGSNAGFLGLLTALIDLASQAHVPLRDLDKLTDSIADDLEKRGGDKTGKRFILKNQYGLPEESLLFFEQSKKARHDAITQGRELASVTADDAEKADAFGKAMSHVYDAIATDFTHLGSDIFPNLSKGIENASHYLVTLTEQKGGVEALFTAIFVGATLAGGALASAGLALFRFGIIRASLLAGYSVGAGVIAGGVAVSAVKPAHRVSGGAATGEYGNSWLFNQFFGDDKNSPPEENWSIGGSSTKHKSKQSFDAETSQALVELAGNNAQISKLEQQLNVLQRQLAGDGGGQTVNVKIDDVTVNTQSTDATGMAEAAGGALKSEFRNALWNHNDGVGK